MPTRCCFWFVVLLLCLVPRASAHLFYLDLRAPIVAGSNSLLVDLRVGDAYRGDVLPRMEEHIGRFEIFDEQGDSQRLIGFQGIAPAGVAREFIGAGLVLYQSKGTQHRLSQAAFEQYAREEGVDHLLAQQTASQTGFESEVFYRCAKLAVGQRGDRDPGARFRVAARATGCPLEIVAVDPGLEEAEWLQFQVLLRGRPLGGALVKASAPSGAKRTQRTDSGGLVRFDLKQLVQGEALRLPRYSLIVSAVHLEPFRDGFGPGEADFVATASAGPPRWSSWWASLTFSVWTVNSEVATGSLVGESE